MSAEQTQEVTQDAPQEAPVVETKPEETKTEGQAETKEESTEEQKEEVKERDEKGRFKGVQPRIDELTKARREAEREAAYWRAQALQSSQAQAQPAQKPTPDQYEDYAQYVEALTDWKTEQKLNERLSQEANRKVEQTRAMTFQERMAEASKTIPDFNDVIGAADTPVAPHVAGAMMESDIGPQLAYHFAKNPQDLQRLNQMSEAQANREIGRLEAQLASKPKAEAPQPRVTNAPKPAAVLGSQGRSNSLDPSKMNMEEYRQWRAKEGARWAR